MSFCSPSFLPQKTQHSISVLLPLGGAVDLHIRAQVHEGLFLIGETFPTDETASPQPISDVPAMYRERIPSGQTIFFLRGRKKRHA